MRSTEAYISGMDYKSILIIWFCIEISRNEWDINFWGMFSLLQKMAAKYRFWEIGERDFLRDPKKYTFGKSNFKTFLKSRIFEILPPFLSTFNTWMELILLKMVSANGGLKNFFYTRTLRVLAPRILQIKPLVYWFVVELMIICCSRSLKMFYK